MGNPTDGRNRTSVLASLGQRAGIQPALPCGPGPGRSSVVLASLRLGCPTVSRPQPAGFPVHLDEKVFPRSERAQRSATFQKVAKNVPDQEHPARNSSQTFKDLPHIRGSSNRLRVWFPDHRFPYWPRNHCQRCQKARLVEGFPSADRRISSVRRVLPDLVDLTHRERLSGVSVIFVRSSDTPAQ